MRKEAKPSPTESPLLFEVDPEPASEVLTALGGMPLVVQAFRSLGVPASAKQHVQIIRHASAATTKPRSSRVS